ncbi:hypothetical protein ABIB42_005208 [Massilia sp. UYP32]|uniref:Metallo-beta-lactamase domain-containing protein n=2 Tax=Telluria group TaxID=2895353 RepID=K9DY32_9BURK|nr:hypothetical protein [Massilia timonae]EKU82185.1 hypothetical protein HMPREF9710_02496 [Massilia timonae CCUG 45783]
MFCTAEDDHPVFILGKESALMTDPINADAARWLKTENPQEVRRMIALLREALAIDFKLVAPGHGEPSSKADVREFLAYLEDLPRRGPRGHQ